MPVQTKAQKWGGSVTAPIPAAIARRLHIVPGSPIEVDERDGVVLVKPVRRRRRRTLAEILRSCQKKFPQGNPHGTVDFGPAVGKEIW
jgi:antitoxin component of MazEF toxin-antitoxin module